MRDRKLATNKTKPEEKITFAESAKIFGKAIKVSVEARGTTSIAVSLVGFAMAFLPMLTSVLVRRFSNEVQALAGKGSSALAIAVRVFVMLSALYIVQLVWNSVKGYFETRDAEKVQQFMKERVLRCSCDVQLKYVDNYDSFRERIDFVNSSSGERVANSVGMSISWLQNIITFISIITVLWAVNIWIVVILVAACAPAVILAHYFNEEEYYSKGFWILEYLMTCSFFFDSTRQESVNDVRFFGAYPWLRRKFEEMNKKYISIKNKVTRKHVFYNGIADIFRSCVYIFILLITVRKIFDDPAAGIGEFMLVFTMAGQLQTVTASIFGAAAQFVGDVSYMRDYFYLDGLDYENRDGVVEPLKEFAVEFDNVSFTYPNTDRKILHDINISIREGEKVAIVGENGSGKTTFVNLLCALYEPDSGTIKMGGEDIFENLSQTRRTLSAIFQDFAKYETSIRDNITVSDNLRAVNDGDILDLARRTGALDVIEDQPAGLDEVVGSFSPTGNNLSGGQWQKIALLRCAYRKDAKVMVLDEPTAALDPIAEAELYRNFTDIVGDRTTILISHRLGIAQLVDRILVFDGGKITEDGTHSELLANGGLYAKMFQAQAHWYTQ